VARRRPSGSAAGSNYAPVLAPLANSSMNRKLQPLSELLPEQKEAFSALVVWQSAVI